MPLTKIPAYLQNSLDLELPLCDFSMYFPLRKVQLYQSALLYVAMATIQLFSLTLKTRISIVFQVFLAERNFLWDTLLGLGHHNTLGSLILANIWAVTMETFQKIIFPKYGHNTKPTDYCHVLQSIISILHDRNPLRCFIIVSNYSFSSWK